MGGGGRGGIEVGEEGYTTGMSPALRWAAMSIMLMFDCEGQGHKMVSTDHNF